MRTTQEDIKRWFEEGIRQKATHMIVVCDTFDHSDYPVYVKKDEDVREVENKNNNPGNMTRVMEVYNLKKDMNPQLGQMRCFEY
jgi:hypothetical protein